MPADLSHLCDGAKLHGTTKEGSRCATLIILLRLHRLCIEMARDSRLCDSLSQVPVLISQLRRCVTILLFGAFGYRGRHGFSVRCTPEDTREQERARVRSLTVRRRETIVLATNPFLYSCTRYYY